MPRRTVRLSTPDGAATPGTNAAMRRKRYLRARWSTILKVTAFQRPRCMSSIDYYEPREADTNFSIATG